MMMSRFNKGETIMNKTDCTEACIYCNKQQKSCWCAGRLETGSNCTGCCAFCEKKTCSFRCNDKNRDNCAFLLVQDYCEANNKDKTLDNIHAVKERVMNQTFLPIINEGESPDKGRFAEFLYDKCTVLWYEKGEKKGFSAHRNTYN